MKVINRTLWFGLLIVLSASCSHDFSNETVVHEDGSIDKIFAFKQHEPKEEESERRTSVSERTGWTKTVAPVEDTVLIRYGHKYQVQYSKSFSSVDEMNKELGELTDTTLQITSTFKKRFRWFYTYIEYSETYHAINRLKYSLDGFITPEDSAFVDRLPAEGKPISHADSVQLDMLMDKLFEYYGKVALSDEYFNVALRLIQSLKIEKRWEDTLALHKEDFFKNLDSESDLNREKMLSFLESIRIPIDRDALGTQFEKDFKSVESKVSFISWATEGTYRNVITMPWEIVDSNADSISGKSLFYNPPVVKFLFKDYTYFATSRRVNYWAFGVSLAAIAFTILLFVRRNRNGIPD